MAGTDPKVGTSLKPGTTVNVVVSRGPKPVQVPNVSGRKIGYATRTLTALGLTVATTEQYSETDGIDFDAIAALNPDVILGVYSGLTQEDYDKLSEIAPTVAYPEGDRKSTRLNSSHVSEFRMPSSA